MFEPNEEAQRMIEDIFRDSRNKKKETELPTTGRRRIRIPEAPAQTPEQEAIALRHTQKEFNQVVDAFINFCHEIEDQTLASYLRGQLDDFGSSLDDMEQMLFKKVDESSLTANGLPHYEKVRKMRNIILNDVYKNHEKGK